MVGRIHFVLLLDMAEKLKVNQGLARSVYPGRFARLLVKTKMVTGTGATGKAVEREYS
jgi:hypothetical protein